MSGPPPVLPLPYPRAPGTIPGNPSGTPDTSSPETESAPPPEPSGGKTLLRKAIDFLRRTPGITETGVPSATSGAPTSVDYHGWANWALVNAVLVLMLLLGVWALLGSQQPITLQAPGGKL